MVSFLLHLYRIFQKVTNKLPLLYWEWKFQFISSNNTHFLLKSSKCYWKYTKVTSIILNTWCVQVLRSTKEAFAAAMQSWRERCEKCVCLQGDYVEK